MDSYRCRRDATQLVGAPPASVITSFRISGKDLTPFQEAPLISHCNLSFCRESSSPRSSVLPNCQRPGSLWSGSAPLSAGGSAGSSGPTGCARRIVGSSRQRGEPRSPYPRTTRWVSLAARRCFRAAFSTALPRARPLGPTGALGSGLVRRPPNERASGGVAGLEGDCREQTNEERDEPAAGLEKSSPESRWEMLSGGWQD
ncbi:uncharacterized protein LOC113888042 [Bos indicus x Bos taurus]|uniref:uncharacterized protein LOC113888042 n=1 Tax=Bos indicus x Bos taurus TaxID=30522 RepID=UPI000F7D1A9A|nr:uncharacterized protein LOC113888042 [Bos indicus x Bos taurus]